MLTSRAYCAATGFAGGGVGLAAQKLAMTDDEDADHCGPT